MPRFACRSAGIMRCHGIECGGSATPNSRQPVMGGPRRSEPECRRWGLARPSGCGHQPGHVENGGRTTEYLFGACLAVHSLFPGHPSIVSKYRFFGNQEVEAGPFDVIVFRRSGSGKQSWCCSKAGGLVVSGWAAFLARDCPT